MLQNKLVPTLTPLPWLGRRRARPILARDVDLIRIFTVHVLAALLPVHEVASANRDIATVNDGGHGVDALVLIRAEKAIG